MILTADGVEYVFHFVHKREQVAVFEPELRWVTICSFHAGKCQPKDCPAGMMILGTGVARVHKPDHFDKYQGRKRSFARALHAAGIDYAKRKELWTSFFVQNPLPATMRIKTLREVYNLWDREGVEAGDVWNWLIQELGMK